MEALCSLPSATISVSESQGFCGVYAKKITDKPEWDQ
jgi:hypothetical protein